MADPHWENLKEIFHAAVALAPEERRAYLDGACDGKAVATRGDAFYWVHNPEHLELISAANP